MNKKFSQYKYESCVSGANSKLQDLFKAEYGDSIKSFTICPKSLFSLDFKIQVIWKSVISEDVAERINNKTVLADDFKLINLKLVDRNESDLDNLSRYTFTIKMNE